MKARTSLLALAGIGLTLTVGVAPVEAAPAASVKVFLTGDCADGEHVEGVDEDDCELNVSVSNKKKNVSARVEVAYDEEDPEWEEFDSAKTRGGRVVFEIPATDEDDVWMDGVVIYRVLVKKAAGVKIPKMREYRVEYVSAEAAEGDEELAEEMAEDKEFNAEMDGHQAENENFRKEQQPNGGYREQRPRDNEGRFDKAAEFNRACGAIQFPADQCAKLVETKSPNDAVAILGDRAEAWCAALAATKGVKAGCAMVLPNVFPPLNR